MGLSSSVRKNPPTIGTASDLWLTALEIVELGGAPLTGRCHFDAHAFGFWLAL